MKDPAQSIQQGSNRPVSFCCSEVQEGGEKRLRASHVNSHVNELTRKKHYRTCFFTPNQYHMSLTFMIILITVFIVPDSIDFLYEIAPPKKREIRVCVCVCVLDGQ